MVAIRRPSSVCTLTALMRVLFASMLPLVLLLSAQAAPIHTKPLATFNCIAFPPPGTNVLLLQTNSDGQTTVAAMNKVINFPLYTVTIQRATEMDIKYEYAYNSSGDGYAYNTTYNTAEGTITRESVLFGDNQLRTLPAERNETLNEFFGDPHTYTSLPATKLPATYNRTQNVKYHTIYDEGMVGTVHIEVDASAWERFIKASSKPKGYFGPDRPKPRIHATYTYINAEKKHHADMVSIDVAGFGSLQQAKKSYNIHFAEDDQKVWGLKYHKVKAMTYDPSLVREYSTIDVFEAMGLPVHRIAWTRLYINGVYVGIYNNLEKPANNHYLHSRFPDTKNLPDGTIYKCNDKSYLTLDSMKLNANKGCEHAQGNVSDYSDLKALIQTFTDTSDEEFPSALEAVFDVPHLLKTTAVELSILRRDGYYDDGSNYMIWYNGATAKWMYLPWDFEIDMFDTDIFAFDKSWSFFKQPFISTSVLPGYISNIPMTRVLTVPKYRAIYLQHVRDTLAVMESQQMQDRLTMLHDTVRPYLVTDPLASRDMAYSIHDFDNAYQTRVEKSKADIAVERLTKGHWDPKIPDILHNKLLDFELMGMKPFMQARAQNVRQEISNL